MFEISSFTGCIRCLKHFIETYILPKKQHNCLTINKFLTCFRKNKHNFSKQILSTSIKMEDWQREYLNEKLPRLIGDTSCSEEFLSYFLQHNILTQEEKGIIVSFY